MSLFPKKKWSIPLIFVSTFALQGDMLIMKQNIIETPIKSHNQR